MSFAQEIADFRQLSEGIISGIMPQEIGPCYVYKIVVDGVVRYIGKGRGRRMHDHFTVARQLMAKRARGEKARGSLFYNKLAKAITRGSVVQPELIIGNLSEAAAFERERQEIAAYPDEQLWNVFSGGVGSTREDCLKAWDNQERRDNHREAMAVFLARPGVRQRMSEGIRRALAKPGVLEARRLAQIKAFNRPEVKAKKSATMKALWNDPAHRERYWAGRSDATWRKMSESAKKRGISPERRAKMNASLKRRLADPIIREEYRQRAIVAANRPEVRAKQAEASKRNWANPEWRARVLSSRKKKVVA